jgi:hypothetical protein
VFGTPPGEVPKIQGFLAIDQGELKVHIHVDGMALRSPQLCDSGGLTTHLGMHLIIDDGLKPAGADPLHGALEMRDRPERRGATPAVPCRRW